MSHKCACRYGRGAEVSNRRNNEDCYWGPARTRACAGLRRSSGKSPVFVNSAPAILQIADIRGVGSGSALARPPDLVRDSAVCLLTSGVFSGHRRGPPGPKRARSVAGGRPGPLVLGAAGRFPLRQRVPNHGRPKSSPAQKEPTVGSRIGARPFSGCSPISVVSSSSPLSRLRDHVRAGIDRSYVPFSNEPTAAALLLDDGAWVPGVRVESASYSLTIPALLNAYTTAVAANRGDDVVAFALSRPFRREERLYVEELPHGPYEAWGDDLWIRGRDGRDGPLPAPDSLLSPFLPVDAAPDAPRRCLRQARRLATNRADAPASGYPVGALLPLDDGRWVPGVNVEHPDWARILCAERNALGTVQSYDLSVAGSLFLSCPTDPSGTPCGACRQVLSELMPGLTLWMDRHDDTPERADLSTLLPGSFRGRALLTDR